MISSDETDDIEQSLPENSKQNRPNIRGYLIFLVIQWVSLKKELFYKKINIYIDCIRYYF